MHVRLVISFSIRGSWFDEVHKVTSLYIPSTDILQHICDENVNGVLDLKYHNHVIYVRTQHMLFKTFSTKYTRCCTHKNHVCTIDE